MPLIFKRSLATFACNSFVATRQRFYYNYKAKYFEIRECGNIHCDAANEWWLIGACKAQTIIKLNFAELCMLDNIRAKILLKFSSKNNRR